MKCYRVIAQIERMKTGRPGVELKITNRYCAENPYYDIIIGDKSKKLESLGRGGCPSLKFRFWTKGTPGVHRLAGKPLPLVRCEPRLHYFCCSHPA